jgi:hypothetical protein
MITKAGVASNMIVAGVSSYGRSFQMSAAGCYTADCTFTGPLSGSLPGQCTDTAGYIADYELDTIISTNPSAESLWDDGSYSNILIYNSNQWVAYVSRPFIGSSYFSKYIQNSNKNRNFFAVAMNTKEGSKPVKICSTNFETDR